MYRILCYGDSNTWGYNAETGDRFPEDVRWTGVLQGLLGPAVRVLEEGQPAAPPCGTTPLKSTETARLPCTVLWSVRALWIW